MPKVASSTTSNTYAEDVDLKKFRVKTPNPLPGTYSLTLHVTDHNFLSPFPKRFITFCVNKILIQVINALCAMKHNLFLFIS